MTQAEKEAQARNWGALSLNTGFYMTDMLRAVLQFADTDERGQAISRVVEMLEAGVNDEQQWRHVINQVCDLLRAHPDAHKESGTWYDGDPTILALAVAKEAASHALYKLFPRVYVRGEAYGAAYKVIKYYMRAMMQHPETAAVALKWLERNLDLRWR